MDQISTITSPRIQDCGYSVSSHIDSGFGPVTCLGQWDKSQHNTIETVKVIAHQVYPLSYYFQSHCCHHDWTE